MNDEVSIAEVERHYATSAAANAVLSFVCSDCGIPVSARLIQPHKPGRKITPSSGFRASDPGRPHTCGREPVLVLPTTPSHGGGPVHSTRTAAPVHWIDPRAASTQRQTSSGLAASSAQAGSGRGSARQRNGPGAGQSRGHSQTVERFARAWESMGSVDRRQTPLAAPWNQGGRGAYFSAFAPLAFPSRPPNGSTCIFRGSVRTTIARTDGFEFELHERAADGLSLRIWFPRPMLSASACAGGHLHKRLLALSTASPSPLPVFVYALGCFNPGPIGAQSCWRLDVDHPHLCWIP